MPSEEPPEFRQAYVVNSRTIAVEFSDETTAVLTLEEVLALNPKRMRSELHGEPIVRQAADGAEKLSG